MRPLEIGRRGIVAGAILVLPVAFSASGSLLGYGVATARRVYELVKWRNPGEVLGASSFLGFSVVCVTLAGLALALSALRVLRGNDEGLERPYTLLRALTLLHGAAGPFLALSATNHLSPTVRGRVVLARYFAAVLEHQAFLAFATTVVAVAWLVGPRPPRWRAQTPELLPRVLVVRSVVVAFALSAVAYRVLGGTFAAAPTTKSGVPSTLEGLVAGAVMAITLALVVSALVVHRPGATALAAEPAPDEHAPPKKPLALLPRTIATVLLPLFSLTIASWASSRPCDPDPSDLSGVPTVATLATRPLPLARADAPASSEEGVLVADAVKRVRDIWPKGGAREVRLVVQRDMFERGKTGIFARFGDGRFGVLRMSFADRDDAAAGCKPAATRRCVDLSHGAALPPLTSKSAEGVPAFVYHADADETVGELAHDVAALATLTYATEQTTPLDLDLDVLVVPPPRDVPPTSKSPRSPVRPHPSAHVADETSPVASVGCGATRGAASFEPHELPVDGVTRRVFVSAPASSEGPRSLVVVLHGSGGGAEAIRRALPLESRLGATSVLLYPEARAGLWDVEAPLASNADVAFLRAAVAWAATNFCIDAHRHFVTGLASGAYLANALACAGDFSAVVAHVQARGETTPAPADDEPDAPSGMWRCKPAAALVLHAPRDPSVPFANSEATAERWRLTNRCSPSLVPDFAAPGCEAYEACDHRVERCIEPELGHGLVSEADVRTAAFFDSLR